MCANLSAHNTDSVFNALSQALKQKQIYQDKKESRIADVKKMLQLPGITDVQRYEIYNRSVSRLAALNRIANRGKIEDLLKRKSLFPDSLEEKIMLIGA